MKDCIVMYGGFVMLPALVGSIIVLARKLRKKGQTDGQVGSRARIDVQALYNGKSVRAMCSRECNLGETELDEREGCQRSQRWSGERPLSLRRSHASVHAGFYPARWIM